MTERARLLVDVVADPVCPWCYVGLRSLAMAKQTLAARFDVLPRFRAYQLNPDTPEEGVDRRSYIERKFPDAAFRATMRDRLMEAAGGAGFAFDPSTPERLPNTIKAHQVLRWAHHEGRQEALALQLYGAFWERGNDIGDIDVLTGVAASAGMDAESVRTRLQGGEDRDVVMKEAEAFRAAGVSGVPTFIVNERTGFSGALPPGDLAAALARAAAP